MLLQAPSKMKPLKYNSSLRLQLCPAWGGKMSLCIYIVRTVCVSAGAECKKKKNMMQKQASLAGIFHAVATLLKVRNECKF